LEAHTSFTTAFLEVPDKDSKIFFFHGLALEACTRDDPKTLIGDPRLVIRQAQFILNQYAAGNLPHTKRLHTGTPLRNRSLSTPELLHEEAYKHTECFHRQARTKAVLHTEAFTQTLLHKDRNDTLHQLSTVFRPTRESKDSETL
jgi:hypothetical protein